MVKTVAETIAGEIKVRGVIPFARFMELALYCPVYGFYEAEGDKIGKRGHYYTSPSVGSLFGELLGWQFSAWLNAGGDAMPRVLVEAGAHRGDLARDILHWLQRNRPELFARVTYVILEPSDRRRKWQEIALEPFSAKVKWVSTPSDLDLPGKSECACDRIIFSNELLDAMPVHRFGWNSASRCWIEWGVGFSGQKFQWEPMTSGSIFELERGGSSNLTTHANPEEFASALLSGLAAAARRGQHAVAPGEAWEAARDFFSILPDGFVLEVCPQAEDWWRTVARLTGNGKLLTFDYGYTAAQFLVPERSNGTLRALHHHNANLDLLAQPGQQDLTAHVNFSGIRRAGEEAGLKTETFVSQAQFVTAVARKLFKEGTATEQWEEKQIRQFHTLTHPQHLGSAFQVLVQSSMA